MTSSAHDPPQPRWTRAVEALATWGALGGAEVPLWSRLVSLLLLVPCSRLVWLDKGRWHLLAIVWIVGARLGTGLVSSRRRGLARLGWFSFASIVPLYGFVLAAAVGCTLGLGWTTSRLARGVVIALLALRVARPILPGRLRVPVIFSASLWIFLCFWGGWFFDEASVSCDDYLAVHAPVDIVVPSRTDLSQCRPGERLPVGRFPRWVRESPDGRSYFFTSSASNDWSGSPAGVDTVTGLLCETPATGTSHPQCAGGAIGKSQGLEEIPARNELLTGSWLVPDSAGHASGRIFQSHLTDATSILSTHDFPDQTTGSCWAYIPRNETLLVFGDLVHPQRISAIDFTPRPSPAERQFPMIQGWDYDRPSDDGLACGTLASWQGGPSHWTNLLAFRGATLEGHPLIDWSHHPALLATMATGCVIDPETRKAYVMLFNLGVLARMDYDTGRIEQARYVGLGLRSLTRDPVRHRLYATDFFGRDIVALDDATLREIRRWTVGRFQRNLSLTHDGKALLTGTNVGLIRIRLDQ